MRTRTPPHLHMCKSIHPGTFPTHPRATSPLSHNTRAHTHAQVRSLERMFKDLEEAKLRAESVNKRVMER